MVLSFLAVLVSRYSSFKDGWRGGGNWISDLCAYYSSKDFRKIWKFLFDGFSEGLAAELDIAARISSYPHAVRSWLSEFSNLKTFSSRPSIASW